MSKNGYKKSCRVWCKIYLNITSKRYSYWSWEIIDEWVSGWFREKNGLQWLSSTLVDRACIHIATTRWIWFQPSKLATCGSRDARVLNLESLPSCCWRQIYLPGKMEESIWFEFKLFWKIVSTSDAHTIVSELVWFHELRAGQFAKHLSAHSTWNSTQ